MLFGCFLVGYGCFFWSVAGAASILFPGTGAVLFCPLSLLLCSVFSGLFVAFWCLAGSSCGCIIVS